MLRAQAWALGAGEGVHTLRGAGEQWVSGRCTLGLCTEAVSMECYDVLWCAPSASQVSELRLQ